MVNTRAAVALDATPPTEELLAAKAAGLTLVQYRAARAAQQAGVPVAMRTDPGFAEAIESTQPGEITITVPWSCLHSINGTWTIRTKEYQGAKRRAHQKIADHLPRGFLPLTCRLAVEIVLVVPDHRPRDLDNYRKLLFDAMKGLVYRDDSLIDDDRMRRAIDCDRPRAEITVRTIGARR